LLWGAAENTLWTAGRRRTREAEGGIVLLGRGRALANLWIAAGIAMILLVLNAAITFSGAARGFFGLYRAFGLTDTVINLLFAWFVLLLLVAYVQWRVTAARESELEDIVASISPDTLLVLRPDRTIIMASGSVKHMFGYGVDEILNRKTDLLYCDRREDRGTVGEIRDVLEEEGFHVGRATGMKKSGATFPLEIVSGVLKRRAGAVLLLRDITEWQRAEAERREIEMRMCQRQKLQSLGLLAGTIAHDFNNVLTVIQTHAHLARSGLPGESPALSGLDGVAEAAGHAEKLCTQMTRYAGNDKARVESVNLSEVVEGMRRLIEVPVPSSVKMAFDLAERVAEIQGDRVQLQQVAMNLVTNAVEALAGRKGGRIEVLTFGAEWDKELAAESFLGEALPEGPVTALEVRDNGGGISEEVRLRMFDPFFTTKRKGRGLGLASVLGIVRGHRAAVRVRSTPGEGTVFTVYFPPAGSPATGSGVAPDGAPS